METKKKKVLIFSTAYEPFVGGAEVAMREITGRIDTYEFHMITALMDKTLPRSEQVGNILVYRIGFGIPFFDKLYLAAFGHRKALRLHKEHSYSLAWSLMASFNGFAARMFKKKTDLPFLLTLQEGDPIEYILHKVRFVRRQFNEIFTLADGLQAISTYLMNWGKDMGFEGRVSEVVPNGVDVGRFTRTYTVEELQYVRDSFELPNAKTILVTASRLVKKNGVADVIRALALLPEDVCFVVCGTGELQSELEALAKDLNVASRVRFLGNKSHDELPKILHASDIFIRPSLTEGLGNAFLEAMAAGLPTIGTMVGGIPDFLEDGKTGFACEVEGAESIASVVERIQRLTEDEKLVIHANAMSIIRDRYNWSYIQKRMEFMLDEICASS